MWLDDSLCALMLLVPFKLTDADCVFPCILLMYKWQLSFCFFIKPVCFMKSVLSDIAVSETADGK